MYQELLDRNKAFTLAEVLITLLIIGVIASIVIPGIIQNSQNAELNAAFKKAYSTASTAWKLVVAENPSTYTARGGWSCTWPTGETQDYSFTDGRDDAFKAKFNVVKSCTNQDGCWPLNYEYYNAYSMLGDSYAGTNSPKKFSWISSDGMCWAAPWYGVDDAHILVDTNCTKGPNLIGKDIFSLFLGKDGIVYFAIGDTSTNGRPVSSGGVCPYTTSPATINGRSVDFNSWLMN